MIIFKTIKWKNFLSTGNNFIEFDFTKTPTTLIIGKNGNGKSQILDALTFVLFGLPFRKVKKEQLINSINKKGTEVIIEFSIGNNTYEVLRAIKPNKLNITVNGKKLNCEGNIANHQKKFENEILKLNYKSFCQTVILGSNFVPFMKLTKMQRREVVEDILELKIFTQMKKVLKQLIDDSNKIYFHLQSELQHQKNTYETINRVKSNNLIKYKQKELENSYKQEKEIKNKIKGLMYEKKKISSKILNNEDVSSKIGSITSKQNKLQFKSNDLKELSDFLSTHDDCPVCSQHIDNNFKSNKLTEIGDKLEKFKIMNSYCNVELNKLNEINENNNCDKTKLIKIDNDIIIEKNNYKYITQTIKDLNLDISQYNNNEKKVNKEKESILKSIQDTELKYNKIQQKQINYSICSSLMKDEAVKSKVVDYYLPIINTQINNVLHATGLYIDFKFNGDFQESIKSRGVDEFNYESFSEGEKSRIDIAILLALNLIAKQKNSINTNIMIFDEIFDSSLDTNGTESLHSIFKTIDNTSITCISHRENILDNFDRVIKVDKDNNFSVYSEINT